MRNPLVIIVCAELQLDHGIAPVACNGDGRAALPLLKGFAS